MRRLLPRPGRRLRLALGLLVAIGLSAGGVAITSQLLLSAVMCLASAWLGARLYRAECDARITL